MLFLRHIRDCRVPNIPDLHLYLLPTPRILVLNNTKNDEIRIIFALSGYLNDEIIHSLNCFIMFSLFFFLGI